MKKCLLVLLLLFSFVLISCVDNGNNENNESSGNNSNNEVEMNEKYKNYNSIINNLSLLPVNFVYDGTYYSGLPSSKFTELERKVKNENGKTETYILLQKNDTLQVEVNTAYYHEHDAWEYTVHFRNPSLDQNSGILECLNAANIRFEGSNPVLKGILGDHANQYAPYEYDLTKEDVNFTSTLGRATHIYFPYFNLEHNNGGALIAIGWAGTWAADFKYDKNTNSTNFIGQATLGLKTYLKPGENIRTPLIAIVNYDERDEDKAMNKWRKWFVEYNLPRDNASSDEPVKPSTAFSLAYDTGKSFSDGSIAENYSTWKQSMDTYYDNGLSADFRWMDAGWYYSPYNSTVNSDWWGTVGSWKLDKVKWPNSSFVDSVEYANTHGTKTLLWFEPERVTHLDAMVGIHGYKREWVLSDSGNNNCYLNNLGIEECLEWTLNRIISVMDENNIALYREDFNVDPAIFWSIGDGYQGKNRIGITENLYIQGHYTLYDEIIAYCAQTNKCTYIDSCAAGGGRNDLETMRRAVPFLRSDSDRTTIELRLAMTTRLVRWLPFTGAPAKESSGQISTGNMDIYVLRASMLPSFRYSTAFYHEKDKIDWETLRQGQAEWNMIKKYFYSDFYVLTPQRNTTDNTVWTAYEYFDSETNSGVIQAFRGVENEQRSYIIKFKGIDPECYYSLTDLDGINSYNKIKGSKLLEGFPIIAEDPRTAITIYIKPE